MNNDFGPLSFLKNRVFGVDRTQSTFILVQRPAPACPVFFQGSGSPVKFLIFKTLSNRFYKSQKSAGDLQDLCGYLDFLKNITVLSNSTTIVPSGFLPRHLIRTMPASGLDFDARFSMISLSAYIVSP